MGLTRIKQNLDQIIMWFCFGIAFISLVIVSQGSFLSGTKLYCHDSIVSMTNMHLFFDSIFRGELPLWSHEINCGQPIWHQIETMPSFDPTALLIWAIAHMLHQNSAVSYQWTCTVWLTIFSVGGMLCSRYLYKNWWVNFIVFMMLFGGPLGSAIPAQSYGFLIPFRYTPFVIFAFLRFIDSPSYNRAIVLGCVIAASASGYQTVYSFAFLLAFLLIYACCSSIAKTKLFTSITAKHFLLAISVASLAMMPTIVSCVKMLDMFPVARNYFSMNYLMETDRFIKELFAPVLELSTIPRTWEATGDIGLLNKLIVVLRPFFIQEAWHGSGYIGILPMFACLLAPLFFLKNLFYRVFRSTHVTFNALEVTWLTMSVLSIAICLDKGILDFFGQPVFLGLRNWGFILTLGIFSLSQVAVIGIKYLVTFIDSSQYLRAYAVWIKNRAVFCYLLILLFIVINFAFSSLQNSGNSFITSEIGVAKIPSPASKQIFFTNKRQREFDITPFVPFHYEGPSVIHQSFAEMVPSINEAAYPFRVTGITHQFRLPRYQKIISANLKEDTLLSVLGVSAPIIKIVNYAFIADGVEEAANSLRKIDDANNLDQLAIIEGNIPKTNRQIVIDNTKLPAGKWPSTNKWRLISFHPDRVTIDTTMNEDGILVYADNFDDSWKVNVDNKSSELLLANVINKAVFIPKGNHIVEFIYRPVLYIVSFWIRAIIMGLFTAYCLYKLIVSLPNFFGPVNSPAFTEKKQ